MSKETEDKIEIEEEESESEEEFFTECENPQLSKVRLYLTKYSMEKSQKRIEEQKKLKKEVDAFDYDDSKNIEEKNKIISDIQKFSETNSQIADKRPVNSISISNDNSSIITGSWSGGLKTWTTNECKLIKEFKGHEEIITGIAVNPDSSSKVSFASGSMDKTLKLWNYNNEKEICQLSGHLDRLSRIQFHPTGKYIGTTSYDQTWRLWDLSSEKLLYEQEGIKLKFKIFIRTLNWSLFNRIS
jgi:U4/U6 small nuclear ribonucleoprotein PRP4